MNNDLVITGLAKKFGSVGAVALNNVSLTVKEGQFATLLGPSGCGKSTTLNCIAGLEVPDEGVITVGDVALTDIPNKRILPPEQRKLGMVFQSYALWPHMKVFDNVAFSLRLQKKSKDEIKKAVLEALDLVGLVHLTERYPFQLSGGQQQRVALARAAVTSPRLLLLDEPLSNLDTQIREQSRIWLREFQQRVGITTVYVTHDQAEAFAMSDMIAVMNNGDLLQYAPPHELYSHPATPFVAGFIGVTSFLKGVIKHVDGRKVTVKLISGDELSMFEPNGTSWHPDQDVDVAIRSERVEMASDPQMGNLINSELKSSTYLGSKWQHLVETGIGLLKIETHNAVPESQLCLHLPPDAILLFPTEHKRVDRTH